MAATLPIEEMSVREKLQAMEALWAALSQDERNMPVPAWHKSLLNERATLVRDGKARFSDWESAKKRIRARTS